MLLSTYNAYLDWINRAPELSATQRRVCSDLVSDTCHPEYYGEENITLMMCWTVNLLHPTFPLHRVPQFSAENACRTYIENIQHELHRWDAEGLWDTVWHPDPIISEGGKTIRQMWVDLYDNPIRKPIDLYVRLYPTIYWVKFCNNRIGASRLSGKLTIPALLRQVRWPARETPPSMNDLHVLLHQDSYQ